MKSYRLFLREDSHSPDATRFDCDADDAIHAIEQAANAYPDCEVLSVTLTSATAALTGMIFREGEDDYEVHPEVDEGSFWLSVANGSLLVRQRDGALMVEIYKRGCEDEERIAEVSAAYDQLRPSDEVLESLSEAQVAAHKRFAPTADDLWRELGDVPVNDQGVLDADFRHFKTGVHREEVWRWIEDVFPGFSVAKAQGQLFAGVGASFETVQQTRWRIGALVASQSAMQRDYSMTMKSYRLFVLETPTDDEAIRFDCQADNAEHAIKQAVNAYPQGEVVSLSVVDQRFGITGALLRMNESGAYEMHHTGGPVWLSVGNAAVCISQGNDSMRVAVHARGLFKAEQAASVSEVPYRTLRPSDERVFYRLTGADQAVHTRFAPTADDLWAELRDIPVNNKDELEVAWRQFEVGTDREDIWRWLEATHPGFSVAKAQGHP